LLPEARRTLLQAERALKAAQQAGRGETGQLSLGFVQAAIYSILPEILRVYRRQFPEVAFTLHELTTEEQVRALLGGTIDLGLLRTPISDGALDHVTVLREPLVFALPRNHRLARERHLRLEALAVEPFLISTRHYGPSLHDQIISLCHRAGFIPRVVQEADRIQTIIGLVAAGIGVALVPDSMRNLRRSGVAYRPLQGSPTIDIAAAWRRDNDSPALTSLLSVIRETSR
jgi:DNA-binding transcriptional LysR family regulator